MVLYLFLLCYLFSTLKCKLRMKNILNFNNFNIRHLYNQRFVPKHEPCSHDDLLNLQHFIDKHKNKFILTGAGVSTESGLPDYRSKVVGLYDRSKNRPVQYSDFINKEHIRKRYWARNFAGWNKFSSTKPNDTHYALASWESNNHINWLVTQNVDRLHHKAGSKCVTELHGTSYLVKCLTCSNIISRDKLQLQFVRLNPDFQCESDEIRPDADTEIDPKITDSFNIPACSKCGGSLKPDVVFFGENVPKKTVFNIYKKIEESDAFLAIGTSLEVFSGYRFLCAAHDLKKSIAIINIGPTRGDQLATLKIQARCGDIIPQIKI